MCDEALFAQCLPGSWTAVPEVKLAVVSLSLRATCLFCPCNTNSAKRQNGCKPLPVYRFAFLPLFLLDMSKKSVMMLWFIHQLRTYFYHQLFLVHYLPEMNTASSVFSHPNNHLIFTQKSFELISYKNNTKFP